MTWQHPLIVLGGPLLAGYLIGSTPFGVIIARSKGVDLRKVGSGNVGATNCGRACGRKWGYLCFVLDVAKGFVPVFLTGIVIRSASPQAGVPAPAQQAAWLLIGCGAIAGHIFTFWLRFRGGKGVAAALGVVLGVWPYFTLAGAIALVVWVAVTLATRYVSVGSIAAALTFLPTLAVLNWSLIAQLWPMAAAASAMIALLIVRHRANISRLLSGTENKITRGKPGNVQDSS